MQRAGCRSLDSGGVSRRHRRPERALLEHPEVPKQPPEQNENQDGAETAAAQFLCPVPCGQAAKQFAHDRVKEVIADGPRECTDRTGALIGTRRAAS